MTQQGAIRILDPAKILKESFGAKNVQVSGHGHGRAQRPMKGHGAGRRRKRERMGHDGEGAYDHRPWRLTRGQRRGELRLTTA